LKLWNVITSLLAILKVLMNPETISDEELDGLARLIFFVRQRRLGIDPEKVSYVEDEMMYECQVPRWYLYPWEHGINVKDVQQKLALLLIPGVADKFVPKFEHDIKEMYATISRLEKEFY